MCYEFALDSTAAFSEFLVTIERESRVTVTTAAHPQTIKRTAWATTNSCLCLSLLLLRLVKCIAKLQFTCFNVLLICFN